MGTNWNEYVWWKERYVDSEIVFTKGAMGFFDSNA